MRRKKVARAGFILSLFLIAGCVNESRADRNALTPVKAATAASSAAQSEPPVSAARGEVLVTNRLDIDFAKYQVTFLELGADRCIPCKQMQPIMREIAAMFPDRVQVVFYDVWKDPKPAGRYRIQLIPTQVFFDQKGQEFVRHVGLYPKAEILELLKARGIQ
jgi:thioredoxin 1